MGAHSRRKGAAAERELVNLAKNAGLAATRTWATAQSTDPTIRACDVEIAGKKVQSKRVAKLPKLVADGLQHVEMLAMKEDQGEWLLLIRLKDYLHALGIKEGMGRPASSDSGLTPTAGQEFSRGSGS